MSIQGPISSFSVTAAGSNQSIYAGPARILGVYYMNDAATGTIVLYDDATEVFKIQIPDGATTENSNYIEFSSLKNDVEIVQVNPRFIHFISFVLRHEKLLHVLE